MVRMSASLVFICASTAFHIPPDTLMNSEKLTWGGKEGLLNNLLKL
jgi:hypothetical protein